MRALILTAVFALAGFLGFDTIEAKLVYPFDPTEVSPRQAGLDQVTAHRLQRGDVSLVVWTAPAQPGKPVIFYLHGNAGNLHARAGRFARFLARGYGLVAPAYRGSSGSGGTPSQPIIIEDVRAVWNHFNNDRQNTVIYGESLGTGVGILALGDRAPMLLEAPYTSIADVARNSYSGIDPIIPFMKNTWQSIDFANNVINPVMIIHGTKDTLIPIEQGRLLFDAIPAPDKLFRAVPGAGHTDLWRSDVLPDMWRFLERQVP
ncbi:MAG: alpha/beta hydrolase [Sedimentitalea sp.]